MSLQPTFKRRDFATRPPKLDIQYTVDSLEWSVFGGPKAAQITATGADPLMLWELIEYLRCPVEIRDEITRDVWWGMVSDVRVNVNGIEIGASIDTMANNIAVAYTAAQVGTADPSGERKTTAWSSNAESVAEYGTKDYLDSADELSDAAATARRDALLAERRYPCGIPNVTGSNVNQATIICRGWWDTLDWKYITTGSVGTVATTSQISTLIMGYGGGQFFSACDIEAASGININPATSGDKTCLTEVLKLMASGGPNGRRLLASVDINRRAYIYEEPASSTVIHTMKPNGKIYERAFMEIPSYLPPVGKWLRLENIIPDTADITRLIVPTLQFLEGARWSPGGGLGPQFRGATTTEDLLRIV